MPEQLPGKNQEILVGTILLALFSSGLCALGGLVYLIVQWNNPIWDTRVRLIFLSGVIVFAGFTAILAVLYKKRMK